MLRMTKIGRFPVLVWDKIPPGFVFIMSWPDKVYVLPVEE